MSQLSLFTMGLPRIELDGVPVKVETNKALALLVYLAVTGKSQRRDSLVVLLWPDYDRARGRAALRQSLYILNKSLPGDWLKVDRDTLGLDPNVDVWVDVKQFQNLMIQCRGHGHSPAEVCPDCVELLTEAAGLYRGDFLEGFGLQDSVNFDDWQVSQARDLHTETVNALEKLVDWHVGREEGSGLGKAIGHARRCLELDRTNEGIHRKLMESYAKTRRRTAALGQYEECVRILREELGTSPQEETVQLYEAIKSNQVGSIKVPSYEPSDTSNNNLPRQLTSFIGRKREMGEVKSLLSTTYLLTLTGSGGCGKTRLALEVAAAVAEDFPDGVWLVELASLMDPAFVPQEVASILDVNEQPGRSFMNTLSDYLRSKELLLVLDNCEHLIEACATLSHTLLRACPNLKIMATSREGLGITGETTLTVPSLSTPQPDRIQSIETSDLKGFEAIGLFIDRAVAALPAFTLTDHNAPAVVGICHRLDGIPLTIELAAARVKSLSVEEIKTRLDDNFRLLTGGSRTALPRQQTLRATIDWSYNLLSNSEKAMLSRLSVFSGGWELTAAEAVCADEDKVEGGSHIHPDEVLDLLTSLVDKSLVIAEGASFSEEVGGKIRYRMLEMVRDYGRDRLVESGEESTLRNRHLGWFLELAEQAEPELRGPNQVEWLDRLEVENGNMRAALEWSLGSGPFLRKRESEAGLRLALTLWWFWFKRGYYTEGYQWLERTLSANKSASPSLRAKALNWTGLMAWWEGDYRRAGESCEESLALFREIEDKWGSAWSLNALGRVAQAQNNYERAVELGEESLTFFREVKDKYGMGWTFIMLGDVAQVQGDHERAKAMYKEGLVPLQELGDKHGIAWSVMNLGGLAYQIEGDYERAATLLEESLSLFRELGDSMGVAQSLTQLGDTLLRRSDLENAEVLLQESLALSQEVVGGKSFGVSTLYVLGQVAHSRGDYERATDLYKESIERAWERRSKYLIGVRLEALGGVVVAQGQPERGARLLGATEALRQETGTALIDPYDRANHDRSLAALHTQLDEEAFKAAWEEGRAMSVEEAVEFALER